MFRKNYGVNFQSINQSLLLNNNLLLWKNNNMILASIKGALWYKL
ncbi:hypothetical protein BD780_002367 [Clostridium tetanomorphum]|nr:hypothetical protein [Clostridium tetanomorphum]NRS85142.1 hypothetical protein [Clostridium tetanomorphum]NRZ98323.1 hypothetical protein [Clostridium tetanomorphum]SQC03154.1 Uncharacterised protein [Clostridium tetanomorphum]